MWRMLAAIRRNFQNIRKSPKVADESMFAGGNQAEFPIFGRDMERRARGWDGFSAVYSIVRVPLSLLSCLSHPHANTNGADGVWMSSDLAHISEMNHLMVSDSMRYAILM